MLRYLVDANVLSEATKPQPKESVTIWLGQHGGEAAVNPIILGELQYGILALPAGRRRTRLLSWYAEGIHRLRVLDLDGESAHVWANLVAALKKKGRAMPVTDSLIATSALQHDLTLVTRDVGDYQHAGVRLLNPFKP